MLQKLPPRKHQRKNRGGLQRRRLRQQLDTEFFDKHLQPNLNQLLLLRGPANNSLLAASVADLVGADPFPLDRPGAEALVVGVVAGEVAVLDEAAAGVSA